MLTILNRRELIRAFSTQEQAKLREMLAASAIDYRLKVKNRLSPSPFSAGSRTRTGSVGQNLDLAYEYVFFVHKNRYEEALSAIAGSKKVR